MNRACAVEETDEVQMLAAVGFECLLTLFLPQTSIPEAWRSGTLGLVKEASEVRPFSACASTACI